LSLFFKNKFWWFFIKCSKYSIRNLSHTQTCHPRHMRIINLWTLSDDKLFYM
jgi:hypothetical protein